MGCCQFANSHFQMGFTVMGFAEQFGQNILFRQIKMFSKANMRSESSMQKIFFDQLNLFEMSKEKKCLTWKVLFCVCSFDSGYWYTKYSEMVASIMVVFAKWWLIQLTMGNCFVVLRILWNVCLKFNAKQKWDEKSIAYKFLLLNSGKFPNSISLNLFIYGMNDC